jgi:TPR repeat protein
MLKYKILILPLITILNFTASLATEKDIFTDQTRKRTYEYTLENPALEGQIETIEVELDEPSQKRSRSEVMNLSASQSLESSPSLTGVPEELLAIILNYAFNGMSSTEAYKMRGVCRKFEAIILSLGELRQDHKGKYKLIAKANLTKFEKVIDVIVNNKDKNDHRFSRDYLTNNAYFVLGDLYLKGLFRTPDYQKAIKYYNLNLKRFIWGALRKGLMYEEGIGVLKDKVAAKMHYRKGKEYSREGAILQLFSIYYGEDKLLQDYSSAFEMYQKLDEKTIPASCYNRLTKMYKKGLGVKKDESIAAQLYLRIIKIGRDPDEDNRADESVYDVALYKLGKMYLQGRGVNKDVRQALELLEKSAANNYSKSQYYLGKIYKEGQGVEKNEEISQG